MQGARVTCACPPPPAPFSCELRTASDTDLQTFECAHAGASVTKLASGGEQIEMQGDFVDQLAELIIKQFGSSHSIDKADIYHIVEKKKVDTHWGRGGK